MYDRNFGSDGLISSAIGLGSLAFTGAYGPAGRADSIAVIRMALRIGVTMIDTAGYYAGGETERIIGEAIAGRRDTAVLATHGGLRFTPDGSVIGVDGSPEYLAASCEASLRRLGTDRIDLFHLSRVDPRVPIEESIGGLAELVASGKIRHIGLGEAAAYALRRAHAVHPISAVSAEYSMWERSVESTPLGAELTALGVGLVACRPLQRGHLARGRDRSRRICALEAEAADRDIGIARLALAWLLSRHPNVVPVPSTRSRIHLEMNAAAANLRLTSADCDRLAGLGDIP